MTRHRTPADCTPQAGGPILELVNLTAFSIPLAVLMTFYWVTFANAPLIALAAALAFLLFRFAPTLVRERYLGCLAAMIAIAAGLACDPLVSLGGPQPGLVVRALGFALVLSAAAWERRHNHAIPRPGSLIGWVYRTMVVVLALPAYAATLTIMR
jgi:hypothetical protein